MQGAKAILLNVRESGQLGQPKGQVKGSQGFANLLDSQSGCYTSMPIRKPLSSSNRARLLQICHTLTFTYLEDTKVGGRVRGKEQPLLGINASY